MKASKKEMEGSILFFARMFSLEENYKALMKISGFPKVVELIVYKMFLQKFNPYNCVDEDYEQYKILLEFVTELEQNGFVTYES